jgi:enamine deaminase RidA (YjgF/YER057c/UK114 family)
MRLGNLVFVSGQAGRDPGHRRARRRLVEAQTEQVLKNIATILAAAGTGHAARHPLRRLPRGHEGVSRR